MPSTTGSMYDDYPVYEQDGAESVYEHDNDDKLKIAQQLTQTQTQATAGMMQQFQPRQQQQNHATDGQDSKEHDPSSQKSTASSDSNNPFAVLQQQLLELEEAAAKNTTTKSNTTCTPRSSIDSNEEFIHPTTTAIATYKTTAGDPHTSTLPVNTTTGTNMQPTTVFEPTQQDWPDQCEDQDDWDYDNDQDHDYHQYAAHDNHDQQLEDGNNNKKQQSSSRYDQHNTEEYDFGTATTSSHQLIIDKSRKRARKSQTPNWSRHTKRAAQTTSIDVPASMRTPVSLPMPVVNKSVEPTPSKHSIIGLRPNHWGFTPTPYARPARSTRETTFRSTPHSNKRRLSTSHSTSRTSRLARATAKRGPLSFTNTTRTTAHKTPSKPTSTPTSFTPAFIKDVPVDDDEDDDDDTTSTTKENTVTKPWFLNINNNNNTVKPRTTKLAAASKQGPLQQKLARLRAATNADIVRFPIGNVLVHSRSSKR